MLRLPEYLFKFNTSNNGAKKYTPTPKLLPSIITSKGNSTDETDSFDIKFFKFGQLLPIKISNNFLHLFILSSSIVSGKIISLIFLQKLISKIFNFGNTVKSIIIFFKLILVIFKDSKLDNLDSSNIFIKLIPSNLVKLISKTLNLFNPKRLPPISLILP